MRTSLEPSLQERKTAAVCHLASIPFPVVGPIAFLIFAFRRSRFIRLHATQALVEALLLNAVLMVSGAISLVITLVRVWGLIQSGEGLTWDMVWESLLKSVFMWAMVGLVSLAYTIGSIFQAIRAWRGEWKPSMVSGRLAERWNPERQPLQSQP